MSTSKSSHPVWAASHHASRRRKRNAEKTCPETFLSSFLPPKAAQSVNRLRPGSWDQDATPLELHGRGLRPRRAAKATKRMAELLAPFVAMPF